MKRKNVRVQRSMELKKGRKEARKPKGVYVKPKSLEEMMDDWRKNGDSIK